MKIIFLGLLIAVLVVYGHGDDSNEPSTLNKENHINEEKEVNETKAKKIEHYQKENVEGDQKLSVIKDQLSDPNLSTEQMRDFLRLFGILVGQDRGIKRKKSDGRHGAFNS